MSEKITYTKDKQGEGYLLRGPSGLRHGDAVQVTKKDGSTKAETVGALRAGPFDDGVCLYEIARGGASKPKARVTCPHCGEDINSNSNGRDDVPDWG